MAMSLVMWVGRVVTEALGSLIMFLLSLIAAFKVYEEYCSYQSAQKSAVKAPRIDRVRTHSAPDFRGKSDESTNASTNTNPSDEGINAHSDDDQDLEDKHHNVHKPLTPRSISKSKSMAGSSKTQRKNGLVVWFAVKIVSVCVCFFMVNLNSLLALFGAMSCSARNLANSFFWAAAIAVTEIIFVDRIATVYRDSSYEYSQRTLRVLYTSIVSSRLFFLVIWLFYGEAGAKEVNGYSQAYACKVRTDYPAIPAGSLLAQLLIEVSTLKMFTSPLRKLCKLGDGMDEHCLAMARLARKSTILTYVMVLSTFFTIAVVLVSSSLIANPFYTVVFCTCLLLFPHWFDDWYPLLCALPIILSDQCCSLPKHVSAKQVIHQMQRQVTSNFNFSSSKSHSNSIVV